MTIYIYNIMSYYYIVHCNWLWFIYVCINMLNVIDVVDHGAPLSLLNTGDTSAALRGAVSLIGENPNVSVRALGSWPCRKSSTQKSSDSLSCSPCFFCDFGYTPFSHTHMKRWKNHRESSSKEQRILCGFQQQNMVTMDDHVINPMP